MASYGELGRAWGGLQIVPKGLRDVAGSKNSSPKGVTGDKMG